jgi:hypothetical protein
VDHQIDRRHAGSDGKPAAKVDLGLLQHGIVLPLGDGQMRDDLVELPAERWGLRPPVRDRLGEPAEREVRFGDEIQDPLYQRTQNDSDPIPMPGVRLFSAIPL